MTDERESMHRMVAELFRPSATAQPDGSIGAELELIPVRNGTRQRARIVSGDEGPGTAEMIRGVAPAHSWRESVDAYGAPGWTTPDGSRVSYEPGGQIEISSPVVRSPAELEHSLRDTVALLRDAAGASEISLLATGVDPYNGIDDVILELHAPRYESMTRYFDSINKSGVRMMRQTASLQVSVELGANPLERWALLNALAPYLLAASANSHIYAGQTTGYASYRAHLWQTLDHSRTGLPFDAIDPIGAYTEFARDAGRILADDAAHLTTLFPEIRPRGYFEIRSMDAMEPSRVGEMLRFIHGIIHRADVATEARNIIGAPDSSLLGRAALLGRSDRLIDQRLTVLERLI